LLGSNHCFADEMSTILSCFHLKLRDISPQDLVKALKAQTLVKAAQLPRFFIRRPNTLDADILNTPWDLIVFLDGAFPADLEKHVETSYRTSWEVPTQALNVLESVTATIKAAPKQPLSFFKPKDASCVVSDENEDNLGRTAPLQAKARELLKDHDGPVTCVAMLNFFKGGAKAYVTYYEVCPFFPPALKADAAVEGMRQELYTFGQHSQTACRSSVAPWRFEQRQRRGRRRGLLDRGGTHLLCVSLVFRICLTEDSAGPSIAHFCDMLWNEQYQEVNKACRLGVSASCYISSF
jgi:hypothetical protein